MKKVALHEICELKKGRKPNVLSDEQIEGWKPYILIQSFDGSRTSFSNDTKCTECKEEDTLIVSDGARSGLASFGHAGYIGSTIAALAPNKEKVSPKYLYNFVQSQFDLLNTRTKGATIPHLDKAYLMTMTLYLPPLSEQERIVSLLDEAESLRATRERANVRMEQFVPALFQEMFGKLEKLRTAKIGEITQVKTGGTPSRKEPKYFEGNIPWVKTTEVNQAVILDTEEKITQEAIKNSNCEIFPPETILLAMYGQGITRGRTGKLGISATTNQACAAILPSAEYDTDYLWALLQMSYEELRSLGRGGNQPNLNLSIVKNFEVTLPPLALQREFAAWVEEARGVQSAQGKSAEKVEALYQSMLARAFAGEL